MRLGGNEYSVREAAGAFGDLGTLVPFAVGYMTIAGLPPQGVLLSFGLVAIAEPALPVPVSRALELRAVSSRSSPLFVLFLTLRI